MTWYPISHHPIQYENSSGLPYSGAVLKAYEIGTTTVLPMATDATGATTASSFALNASGYPVTSGGSIIIPHIQQNYKLALYPTQAAADANSGAIWTIPSVTIANAENEPFEEWFSGDGTTTVFNLSEDMGTDERVLLVFADKKFGEYSTNGAFATDTGWTKGSGWTIGAGVATATGAISTDLTQTAALPILAGESYTVTYTMTQSAGSATVKVGGTSGTARSSSGTYTETIIAGSTQAITFSGSGFTGTIDNVSVHRTTAARREVHRSNEFTLVNNTLTFTEAPAAGTNNIIVTSPSTLFGALGDIAAGAATSETNALNSANNSAASATASQTASNISKSAAGFTYTYDTDTSAVDPGTGKLQFNNATLSSATELYISETTGLSQAIAGELATWDDGTSTIKSKIRMFKQSDPAVFAIFNITGTLTDNGGWDTLTVAYVTGSGSFSDDDVVTVQNTLKGDKGDTGATGPTGPTGPAGGGLTAVVDDTSPQLGGDLDVNGHDIIFAGGTITNFLDEDNMASDSATAVPSQQSVKAYVDAKTGVDFIGVLLESPADGDYRIVVNVPYGGTITDVTTRSASGTCTLTTKINTTALGGTANSVSSSESTQSHSSSNVFAAGDDIVITVSSNSSCSKASVLIKFTRT